MAFGRTEFQFAVSGVESTTRSLQNVAAAETAVAAQAEVASRKVMAMDAAAAALGVNLDSTGRVMQGATRSAGALGKALELAGSGLTIISRAAAILPGFGIAGLLLAIAEGGKAVYEAMTGVSSATADASREIQYQAALAREHTDYMEKQAAAARDLARSMTEVGESFLSAQSGISAGAGGSGYLLGALFGGDLEEIKAEKIQLRERAGALKKAREDLMRDFENAAVEYEGTRAAPAIRAALDARLKAIETEANNIRQFGNNIRDREVDLMRAAKGMLGSADKGAAGGGRGGAAVDNSLGATVGRIAAEQTPRRGMEAGALAGIGGMAAESYDASAEAARARAQEMADLQLAQDQRNAMMISHMEALRGETVATASAMDMLAGSFDGAFGRMVDSATNAGGLLTQALTTITGAIGSMMTNIIISGNAGSKGVAKAAGNALAGLSAQAFGYGVLLEGLALAAALVPGLGFSAPSLAAAGAVMFGVGGTLGLTARALGADKLGAKPSGSGAYAGGGGGGGSAAAVGTGGGGGRGDAPIYVSVQIGEEPVAAIMRRSNEREARRGGMSGHFAMGAA